MIKKTDVYVLFSGRTTRITLFLFCRNTKRYRKRFKSAQSSCWGSAVRFPQVFCQKKGKTFNTMTCFYIVCFAWQSPVWTLSEPNENATKGATSPLNWTKSQVRIEVRKLVWLAAGLELYTTQVHLKHPSLPLVPPFPDTTVLLPLSIEMNSSHLFQLVWRQCSKGTDVYPLVVSSEAPLRQTLKEQLPRSSTLFVLASSRWQDICTFTSYAYNTQIAHTKICADLHKYMCSQTKSNTS